MPYIENAALIPGRGAVLTAPQGTAAPTADEIVSWVRGGATGKLGAFEPYGYTSLDALPKLDGETEGGEVKGAWENPSLRTTPTKVSDFITVTGIQWSGDQLAHRFGKGTSDTTKGHFSPGDTYTSDDVALLVVFIDGDSPLGLCYPKATPSPTDSIEADPENFLGMPIKFTPLKAAGKPKTIVIAPWLKAPAA